MRRLDLGRVEVLEPDGPDAAAWSPVRHLLGIGAFGVNLWHGREPGDLVVEDHDEVDDGHEELYVVLSGRARFVVGDEQADADAGTLIAVDPQTRRTATALEPGTVVLVVGAPRGAAFTPSEWERRALGEG
ncbi:MAG TPA: hypothetical protein VHB30_04605 [Solirubrobacteraceae bacterium]|jgi:hypothetical protein|nr:hypothetical protein [Solirubrobacteraceae bacterium]